MSQQLDAIFVALKLQVQNRTCKPGASFSAICRRDIAGVSNMFDTCRNFSATKIASSCRDKNRLRKRAFLSKSLRLVLLKAAVTEKVWGEYVSVVCQILAKRNTKMSET